MSLAELLPIVRALPRIEKLHLIEALAHDLAQESSPLSHDGHMVNVPDESYEAAQIMLRVLEEHRSKP